MPRSRPLFACKKCHFFVKIPNDIQDLFEYLSDEEVVKYEPYKPQTLNETKQNLEWRIGF